MQRNSHPVFRSDQTEIVWLCEQLSSFVNSAFPEADFERLRSLEIPTCDEITEVLNTVFWTSLLKEEGRSLAPCVFVGEPRLGALQWVLATPRPFSPAELAKLASGTDHEKCYVGLRRTSSGQLEMWGLSAFPNTAGLIVETADPGSLVVRNALRALALFKPNRPPVLLSEGGSFSSKVISQYFLCQKFPSKMTAVSVGLLRVILKSMVRRRLGGTLLIVDTSDPTWRDCVTHGYEFSSRPMPSELLAELSLATEHYVAPADEDGIDIAEQLEWNLVGVEKKYKERSLSAIDKTLSVVSRISSIDGATILSQDLELLEAGAKISVESTEASSLSYFEVEGPDNNPTRQKKVSSLGGTRHQSAVRFVASYQRGAAFVVSQDGRVSLFLVDAHGTLVGFRLEPHLL